MANWHIARNKLLWVLCPDDVSRHFYEHQLEKFIGGFMLSMRRKVLCQYWGSRCLDTKYSAIPGVKTLHLDLNSKNHMLTKIQASNEKAKTTNSGIILKPIGHPKEILVDEETYQEIKQTQYGLKITLSNQTKKRTD